MAGQLENYPYIPIAYPDDVAKAQPGRLNIFMNPLDETYYGKDHYGKLHSFNSESMKTLKTTLSVAQIQAGIDVIALPKAPAGFVNNVSQITLDLSVYNGVPYDPNSYISASSSNAPGIELMNEDPNTFSVLISAQPRQSSIGYNITFISPFFSNVFMAMPYDLLVRANGAGVAGNSTIDVIVYYTTTKLAINP